MRSGKDKYDIIGKDRWLWVEEEDNMHVEKTKTDEVKEEWTMESLESTILIKAAVSITLEAPIIYLNGQVIYSGGGGGSDVPDTYNTHTHPPDTASPPDPQM